MWHPSMKPERGIPSLYCILMVVACYHVCCMSGDVFVCHIGKFVLIRVFWISSGTLNKFRDLDVYFKCLETLDDLDDTAGQV
jgi:hypothetical protein